MHHLLGNSYLETSENHYLSGAKAPNYQQRPAQSRALKPDLSGAVNSLGIYPPDERTFSEVSYSINFP
jgi:hypothetical protein